MAKAQLRRTPYHHTAKSLPAQENRAPAPIAAPQPQVPAQPADLIDFGQDNVPQVQQQHFVPADLLAAQIQNNGQQQKDLEHTLNSTSTPPNPERKTGSLIDYHEDLKKDLPAIAKLQRQDTDTQSVDEFVDAEG